MVLSRHRSYLPLLTAAHNDHLLRSLFACLGTSSPHNGVVDAVLSVCENLLLIEEEEKARDKEREWQANSKHRKAAADEDEDLQIEVIDTTGTHKRSKQQSQETKMDVRGMPAPKVITSATATTVTTTIVPALTSTENSAVLSALQELWTRQVSDLLSHMHTRLLRLNTRDAAPKPAAAAAAAASTSTSTSASASATTASAEPSAKPRHSASNSGGTFVSSVFPKRELSVLARLAGYARDGHTAWGVAQLLLPALKAKKVPEQTRLNVLMILRDLTPLLSVQACESMVAALSRQFLVLRAANARAVLAQIFEVCVCSAIYNSIAILALF